MICLHLNEKKNIDYGPSYTQKSDASQHLLFYVHSSGCYFESRTSSWSTQAWYSGQRRTQSTWWVFSSLKVYAIWQHPLWGNNLWHSSKTSDEVLLDPEQGCLIPALPTESNPLNCSLLKRRTPSTSFPQLWSPGSQRALIALPDGPEREAPTKGASTAAHTEHPSLLGFKAESLSGQGRS